MRFARATALATALLMVSMAPGLAGADEVEREELLRILRTYEPSFALPPDDGRGWIITLRGGAA